MIEPRYLNSLKPPVKCMVQNETRGFSFRKNSKKMARVQKSGVVFLYTLVCFLSDDDDECRQHRICIETGAGYIVPYA